MKRLYNVAAAIGLVAAIIGLYIIVSQSNSLLLALVCGGLCGLAAGVAVTAGILE